MSSKEQYKCCNTPFTQVNVKTGITSCLSCKKKYSIESEYECPLCHVISKYQIKLNMIDADKHGGSNMCDSCGKRYCSKNIIEHIIVKLHD
jgi:hypothetical protein